MGVGERRVKARVSPEARRVVRGGVAGGGSCSHASGKLRRSLTLGRFLRILFYAVERYIATAVFLTNP